MPRYRTISRWFDKTTGEYIDPPIEVELSELVGERLVRARCLERLPDETRSVDAAEKVEPPKPSPGPSSPKEKSTKARASKKKSEKAGG